MDNKQTKIEAQKIASKKYREKNREKINLQRKIYYQKRKENDPNFLIYKREKARLYYRNKKLKDKDLSIISKDETKEDNKPETKVETKEEHKEDQKEESGEEVKPESKEEEKIEPLVIPQEETKSEDSGIDSDSTVATLTTTKGMKANKKPKGKKTNIKRK